MGVPLVNILAAHGDDVTVTSRSKRDNAVHVTYKWGNAQEDFGFTKVILKEHWDVIVDFLVYGTAELKKRIPVYLASTEQYVFFSSSRVYAESEQPLTEVSPRLLDVCTDQAYLSTDEYALAKAREEDLLFSQTRKNWTVIRPYITYNRNRIQLGVFEKENWLYRGLKGKKIIFPRDIADRFTNLTYGPDVAENVFRLLGNKSALGEVFHIVNPERITWRQVAGIYDQAIYAITGTHLKIDYVDNAKDLQKVWNPWQIKFDRMYDRTFDSSKIKNTIGNVSFTPIEEGLPKCLYEFLKNPQWLDYRMNWRYEAWVDKQEHERTCLKEIKGIKRKGRYIIDRFL